MAAWKEQSRWVVDASQGQRSDALLTSGGWLAAWPCCVDGFLRKVWIDLKERHHANCAPGRRSSAEHRAERPSDNVADPCVQPATQFFGFYTSNTACNTRYNP
jgi:hypothetical protein